MKKYLIIIILLLITGCTQNNKEKISMECNGLKIEFTVENGNEISCNISDKEYIFKIKEIKDNKILFSTNNKELKDNNYTLLKDKELKIDIDNQYIIFKWN